ncbi:hypothetical protein CRI85_02670 [Leuconostoc pseudomesenteroides]|nr:hypothetical protein [Leuconostoc pseudomesenteroides]
MQHLLSKLTIYRQKRRRLMADMVIQFFKQGFYNADDMKLFVQVQWLTAEQYKETTGIDYVVS